MADMSVTIIGHKADTYRRLAVGRGIRVEIDAAQDSDERPILAEGPRAVFIGGKNFHGRLGHAKARREPVDDIGVAPI